MPSGTNLCFKDSCGIFFWGAHGHDAIWHIALSGSAFTTLPFHLPIYSGESLQGYNYLFDLITYLISLFNIPIIFVYFKIFPLIWFFLITALSIRLAKKIHNSPLFVGIYLFFIFFGGSFGYLLSLKNSGSLWESSSLLAMQSGHSLINPPYAISLIFILAILNILIDKKQNYKVFIVLGILTFLCFAFKFYAGVIGLVLIVSNYFFTFLKKRNISSFTSGAFLLFIFAILSIFLFYDPFGSSKSGSAFSLSPLSLIHPFIEERKLFYMEQTVLARYFLQEQGIGPRLLYIEGLTISLFLFFNFGTRIFGFLYIAHLALRKKLAIFDLSVLIAILTGILLPSLFVQRGEWWNTIQFFYFSLFLANIYISQLLYKLISKKTATRLLLFVVVLILTIPINIDLLRDFTAWPSQSFVPKYELEALSHLRKLPEGIVLTAHHNKNLKSKFQSPYPLAFYDDTAYVSAFSKKTTYISNETQLRLLGIDYKKRMEKLFRSDCNILDNVDYIYELKQNPIYTSYSKCNPAFKLSFQNKIVQIYSKK